MSEKETTKEPVKNNDKLSDEQKDRRACPGKY